MRSSRLSLPLPGWLKKLLLYLLVLLFWFGLWYVAARRIHEQLILPSPGAVLLRLGQLIRTAGFWRIVALSLLRILRGMAIGILAGALLAMATHFIPPLYTLFHPFITVIRSTPVVSFIILVYFWMGRDLLPSFISVLMVLPVVWANLHETLEHTDPALLEMAEVYRFTPWQKLWRIYFPSALPAFTASFRSSVGLSWKAGIAAEALTVPAMSIGKQLIDARQTLEPEDLLAWTLTVILLSLGLELLMLGLMKLPEKRRRHIRVSSTEEVNA